ncbi:MAG: VTT domain-containing protein [Chloroflexota bacterium]|nr:VTT domain-containing protein [Chloroflexota bacterium]
MLGEDGAIAGLQRRAVSTLRTGELGRAARGASTPRKILGFAALVALNVALFYAPIDYRGLGAFAYVGAFLVTLLANAAVVVPVPYIPIVAHISETAGSPAGVVLAASLGSALGESVAFFVGRVETDLFTGHPWYERIRGFFSREARAFVFLVLFAMPLNPFFDVGGFAAGALGISFRTFFVAVWLGRVVRFTALALLSARLLAILP